MTRISAIAAQVDAALDTGRPMVEVPTCDLNLMLRILRRLLEERRATRAAA